MKNKWYLRIMAGGQCWGFDFDKKPDLLSVVDDIELGTREWIKPTETEWFRRTEIQHFGYMELPE